MAPIMKLVATAGAIFDMTEKAWKPISDAPFGRDLEVAVVEGVDTHVLIICCRRVGDGWINAATGRRIDVNPTHWREWQKDSGTL